MTQHITALFIEWINYILGTLMPFHWPLYLLYGAFAAIFYLVGSRLIYFNKPDAPYMSPFIRVIAAYSEALGILLGAGLLIIAAVLAALGQASNVLGQLWYIVRTDAIASLAGMVAGCVISFAVIVRPIPQFERGGGLDDIHDLLRNFKEQNGYNPRPYFNFAKGCFIGKDKKGRPLYVPWAKLHETHIQVVGMTGSGKGVLMSLIAYQCVLAGQCVVWFDAKFDKYSARLMRAAAKEAGKTFNFINLNADQPPHVNPIRDASASDIEDGFVSTQDLRNKGTDADFYRGRDEDAAIEAAELAAEKGASSLPELYRLCANIEGITKQENFWRRFRKLAALMPINTRQGIDLKKAISQADVIYIVGSTDNERTKMCHKFMLVRVMQLIRQRDRSITQPAVCVILDEFKHMLSNTAFTAIAVLRDFNCHFVLAHQSLGDLYECSGVDPTAAYGAVVDNTSLKFVYKIGDADLAEKLAKAAGMKRTYVDSVSKSAGSSSAPAGNWSEAQTYLISPDVFTHLPMPTDRPGQACTGVLFGMGHARLFYVGPLTAEGPLPAPIPALEAGGTDKDLI